MISSPLTWNVIQKNRLMDSRRNYTDSEYALPSTSKIMSNCLRTCLRRTMLKFAFIYLVVQRWCVLNKSMCYTPQIHSEFDNAREHFWLKSTNFVKSKEFTNECAQICIWKEEGKVHGGAKIQQTHIWEYTTKNTTSIFT